MTDLEPEPIDDADDLVGDLVLHTLVRLANNAGASMGITLTVAGSVITGDLIGGKEYYHSLADSFESARGTGAAPMAEVAGPAFRGIGDEYEDEGNRERPIGYIHLKNARYAQGGTLMPSGGDGMLWRGSIEAVVGWSLGSFEPR